MTADELPGIQDHEDSKRLRALVMWVFLFLATAFLYQAMEGMQRAGEMAERREQLARAACRQPLYEYEYEGAVVEDDLGPADPGASPVDVGLEPAGP